MHLPVLGAVCSPSLPFGCHWLGAPWRKALGAGVPAPHWTSGGKACSPGGCWLVVFVHIERSPHFARERKETERNAPASNQNWSRRESPLNIHTHQQWPDLILKQNSDPHNLCSNQPGSDQ